MEEDTEQFCTNCKRSVTSSNFAIHSAYCERNIYVCKMCEEPVPISEKNQHLEEYHVIFPCDLCEAALEKWMLPKHMESCPRRLMACEYCLADFPFNEFMKHVDFCGSRTEKCLLCQKYVMIKEKDKHNELHVYEKKFHTKNIEEEIKQNKVNEVISHTNSAEKISEKTLGIVSSLASKKIEGADACFSDKSKDKIRKEDQRLEIPAHEGAVASSPEKGKEFSKHYTQCHSCKQYIRWIDYNVHVPACATSSGKCSLCGENVPNYAMKDHMMEHFQGRLPKASVKVPQNIGSCSKTASESDESYAGKSKAGGAALKCPYCFQHFIGDIILEHTRICPKNTYECPLCCEKVSEKDRFMHQTIDCKMLKENIESDRPYPTNTSPMNVYKCSLCFENVSETDRVRHETSDCRMIKDSDDSNKLSFSRNASQMLFECPLCSENIPEENKDSHLSFDCKKLFDSNETESFYAIGNTPSVYECIYCSEKMPEKDKAMHQSFHCKVLIASSGLNIYGSESYAEVTKKTCKANCKCHQSGEICPTCKNRIPKQKMAEHKNSCQRLKLPCLHCNELIDPACEEIHLQFCQALNDGKKYTDPKSRVAENSRFSNYEYKGAIPKNTSLRDIMKPQSAKCMFCQTTLNVDILKFHENECVHKPVQCPGCSKKVLMKDINTHKCKRRKGRGNNQQMERQTIEEREKPGLWEKTVKFFKFSDEKEEGQYRSIQPSNYYTDHRPLPDNVVNRENLYFEQTDNTLLPCEFCLKEFPASQLVLHETGCQPHLVSYANPDSESNLSKSSSRQDCGSLPSNVGPVKKDSASTQIIHASGRSNSFFTGKNSNVQSATYERNLHNKESEVMPGEFLQPYYNKSLPERHGNPKTEENADKEKKTARVKVQAFWNAGSSNDLSTEDDDLKEISDCSDAEMDVGQTEEINRMNKKEREDSKDLDGQVSEKLSHDDNEMTDMLNFLKIDESIVPDDEGEPKNSRTEVHSGLGLKGNTREKHQRDSPVSKKTTIEENIEKMDQKISKFMGSIVNYPNDYASRHLADFKFGACKSTALSDENKAHFAVQSRNSEVPEKLPKQKAIRHLPDLKLGRYGLASFSGEDVDQTEEKKEESRHLPDLRLGRYGLASFSGEDVDQTKEKNDEETKNMYQLKATECSESSNDQREFVNSFKHIENFKFGAYKSTDMPKKENMHFPVRPEKNYSDQEKPNGEKSPKISDSAKVKKEYANNLKHLADKFSAHEATSSFDKENKFCEVLPAKSRIEPEKSYDQKTFGYVDSSKIDQEYLRNFRQHLPDFKFGVLETKSSGDNVHNTILSEKKNGYGERAFKLEPDLHVSSRTTIDKSKNVHIEASSLIDDSRKDNEKCVINIKYRSDIKLGTHAKSDKDSVSSGKCAFTLEAAGSLLKETKFPTDIAMSKEEIAIKILEEKIAALKTRKFKTDGENDDVSKWTKWRKKIPEDSSESD